MANGLSLVRPVPRRVRIRTDEPCAARARPPESRAGRLVKRRHHRQSERQERRKRHAPVDTGVVHSHTADTQDRDGGGALLQVSRGLFPFIETVWADGDYSHCRVTQVTSITVEIVRMIAGQSGFVVVPQR